MHATLSLFICIFVVLFIDLHGSRVQNCGPRATQYVLMKTINQCVPAGETKPCIQDHESPAGLLQDDTFLWFANFCCENGCAALDLVNFCCNRVVKERIPGVSDKAFY